MHKQPIYLARITYLTRFSYIKYDYSSHAGHVRINIIYVKNKKWL